MHIEKRERKQDLREGDSLKGKENVTHGKKENVI